MGVFEERDEDGATYSFMTWLFMMSSSSYMWFGKRCLHLLVSCAIQAHMTDTQLVYETSIRLDISGMLKERLQEATKHIRGW